MNDDIIYIKRCFDLARLGRGTVTPNPIVGAVIVYEGKIIGEGFHKQVGAAHAEINAINSVQDKALLSQSTIYVSLEPCHHYGKTPPCVDSLLRYKFAKVVISVTDPNPRVMGKSIQKLKANGIEVVTHVLEKEGRTQNAFFLSNFEHKRPYIILKYAQSANQIFGIADQQVWVSNAYTKRLVHRWRSEIGAILVATNTALADNPKLDNRYYFGKAPIRILLDRQLRVPTTTHLLSDNNPTIIITEKEKPLNAGNNCEYINLPFDKLLLTQLADILYQKGVDALLVEGGAGLLRSFIKENFWDEARILTGPAVITGDNLIPAPRLSGQLVNRFKIGDNQLDILRSENREVRIEKNFV